MSEAHLIDLAGGTLSEVAYLPLEEALLALQAGETGLSVEIAPADDVRRLAPHLSALSGIGIVFPTFRDGRGYSHARTLRDPLCWRGPMRALGDIRRDQLNFLIRVGFDQFALIDPRPAEALAAATSRFSVVYQRASDEKTPVSIRRQVLELNP